MSWGDGDRLLFAIWAKGGVDLSTLTKIISALALGRKTEIDVPTFLRRQIIDNLADLGHVNIEGRRIMAAEPTLARLPSPRLATAVLCGGRTPELLDALRKNSSRACRLTIESGGLACNPSVVLVSADSPGPIRELAIQTGIKYQGTPPAWTACSTLSSIDEEKVKLEWSAGTSIENWTSWEFTRQNLRFKPMQVGQRGPLPELALRKFHSRTFEKRFWLVKDDMHANADPDWGRFMVLQEAAITAIDFREATGDFVVPAALPLPGEMARALALSTGIAPEISTSTRADGNGFLAFKTYRSIPESIAKIILQKIGQEGGQ